MKETITTCDVCGKRIDAGVLGGSLRVLDVDVIVNIIRRSGNVRLDVCGDCFGKILRELMSLGGTGMMTQ